MSTTTADLLRGHDWFPGEQALAGVPGLYATERVPVREKVLRLHYFVGACDWYVAELDADRDLAFGWVSLGDPMNAEWGYFRLTELRSATVPHPSGLTLVVERDLHWTAREAGDLL